MSDVDSAAEPSAPVVIAGWYDDHGRRRWWDGNAWTATFQDGFGLQGPRPQNRVPLGVLWVAGICCLVLGLIIGGAIGAGQATTTVSANAPDSVPNDNATAEPASVSPTGAPASGSVTQPAPLKPAVPAAPAKPVAPSVPAEYQSALTKAASYSKTLQMSRAAIYDQLTSQYGEQFSAPAAQYAIDNVKADWNANALAKAKSYQSNMAMSPAAIRDQLTSVYGEKFLPSEADFAIQHLND